VGAIKGTILRNIPKANIMDISHSVDPFNSLQAAFILRNCYMNFPSGSIHLICVNSENSEDIPYLCVFYDDHYFIGADNGVFAFLLKNEPSEMIRIEKYQEGMGFPELNVFVPAAIELLKKGNMHDLGNKVEEFNKQTLLRPVIEENSITGTIIYIDSYRNAITNITRELFERIRRQRKFEIYVQSNHYKINRVNKQYNETSVGELLALFNTADLLEIAINSGNAADLLNLGINSSVRIKFLHGK
ncbi:MAG: SAM hydrolase/SAM-dependent halogenase family protein, partial [Bacteroidota bacterium]